MAPSKELNDAFGAIGVNPFSRSLTSLPPYGACALLASMMAPQLYKLYKMRRAHDISFVFLFLYLIGTLLLFVYLYFEGATVAWICLLVEIGLLLIVMAAKAYLDHWGPYSPRALRQKGAVEPQQAFSLAGGQPGVLGPQGSDASKDSSRRASAEGHQASKAERGAAAGAAVQQLGVAAAAAAQGAAQGVRQRSQHG